MAYLSYNGQYLQYGGKYSLTSAIDIDGNYYTTTKIGDQEWMCENLKTTKYRDGTSIFNTVSVTDFKADTSGGYSWFNNNIVNKTPYGAYYNWFAVNSSHGLAPDGWRIPTYSDFVTLGTYLGGETQISANKINVKGTTYWDQDLGNTNIYQFSAMGVGQRNLLNGSWVLVKTSCEFRTSTIYAPNPTLSYIFGIYSDNLSYIIPPAANNNHRHLEGQPVRCIRNV
jgi:uncharacterized protein (TIGR02145 family)